MTDNKGTLTYSSFYSTSNNTKSSKCSVLERARIIYKTQKSYIFESGLVLYKLQKSSMLFVFNNKYQDQIIQIAQAIKNRLESLYFFIQDNLECIKKIVQSGYQSPGPFNQVLDKAANQKRINKAVAQLEYILNKLMRIMNFIRIFRKIL